MTRLLICVILLLFVGRVSADEPPTSGDLEKQNVEAALKLTRESAAKYEFSLTSKSAPLMLREQPILRWSNPERGQIYGNVFLWTRGGRPEMVGSLFKWFSPFTHMSHEFHSLSLGEVATKYDSKDVWRVTQPGVTFAPVPDAPAVAATPSGRMTQMRQIARQFTARSTDREGLKLELRLLAQPVYRYELEQSETRLLDGALFVFVQGTDPEIWLMLEAQQAGSDTPAVWKYALARMNSITFDVQHTGRDVWHLDTLPWAEISGHKTTYTSFMFK